MALKYAFFKGCKIPHYVPHYETATKTVLNALGVELIDLEFGCCGYPVRQMNPKAFLSQAAKNLAMARQEGLDIFTPCQCCFGSLKKAALLLEDEAQQDAVNQVLADDGLSYTGGVEIKHMLKVMADEVGPAKIAAKVTRPYEDLKVAAHYGCHALRPSKVVDFDDPGNPTLFDELIKATGAISVDWDQKAKCCGNPLWGKNNQLAMDMTANKLKAATTAGAEFMAVGCTYCQIQFDQVQPVMLEQRQDLTPLPSLLYPQLLGLAMGLDPKTLGIDKHNLDAGLIYEKLPKPEEEEPEAEAGDGAEEAA
jgi:heterodisulfide reductase subunit B